MKVAADICRTFKILIKSIKSHSPKHWYVALSGLSASPISLSVRDMVTPRDQNKPAFSNCCGFDCADIDAQSELANAKNAPDFCGMSVQGGNSGVVEYEKHALMEISFVAI